jgi:hypothetical protein
MPVCETSCLEELVPFNVDACDLHTRPGGTKRAIFAKCDVEFEDITDLEEWETKLTAGDIVVTGQILGSKAKSSVNKKKIFSCRPETVVSETKTVQWTDSNATDNLQEYAAYAALVSQIRQGQLIFGFTGCGDLFYGWNTNIAIEADDVIPESNDDEVVFDATLTWNHLGIQTPTSIPGLEAVLAAAVQS